MIEELREQAQAIRAEGGEQMLADLLCRAADALEAERKAHAEILERELAKLERALRKAKLGIEHALMFSTMHVDSRKTLNEICTEVTSALEKGK